MTSQASFIFPASFAQRRLWFLDQFEPGHPVYNLPFILRIRGPLQPAVLQQALQAIVERHESLRTAFATIDGAPVQVVSEFLPLALAELDLRDTPAEQREAEALWLAQAEARRPFDLTSGPLLRAHLLRLAAEESLLLLVAHHIVFDNRSRDVLVRELVTQLSALQQGRLAALPELPIQYADYAAWQQEWLQGPVLERQLEYWRSQLAAAPTVLELPTDLPRPAVQRFEGAYYRHTLPASLVRELRGLGAAEGATLFIGLLTVFKVLLVRYSGQERIAIGTPIANRPRPETAELIGFLMNTLVLFSDLSGDPDFRTALRRVRAMALDAYANQDLPFEQLVEALQPERSMSHAPLVQVLFTLQEPSTQRLHAADLELQLLDIGTSTAKFDLSLAVQETGERLECLWTYNTELFEPATVARLAGYYETLLASAVATPELPLSALPLLSAAEATQVLQTWNATAAPQPPASLPALLAAQAHATPDALALVTPTTQLAYAALHAYATQLAHTLRALPLPPDALVALALPREAPLLVALLATLHAGAAYLPLDLSAPPARLQHILSDAQPALLLTTAALAPTLPTLPPGCRLHLLPERLAATPAASPPLPAVDPQQAAYVLYTSGSTGQPKGVTLSHAAVRNCLLSFAQALPLTAHDRVLAQTTLAFDIAAIELLLPLLVGARVVLAPEGAAADPQALATLLHQQRVTVCQATPSGYRLLTAACPAVFAPSAVRLRLCGGEPLPPDLAASLAAPPGQLWNVYGPTETAIWSTAQLLAPSSPLSIGRPIANTQVYVLDRQLRPVPVGGVGELYIGGAGLAQGYHRQPALTAARFVPNPFAAFPNEVWVVQHEGHEEHKGKDNSLSQHHAALDDHAASPRQPPSSQASRLTPHASRLYRTGDLVRWLPNGTLAFVGRRDGQVKLRGYRIELGEIERVLAQHPLVQSAVVVLQTSGTREPRLVGYLVAQAALERSALREWLRERLPGYMVPSVLVPLTALPLTPNGKLDRAALPLPQAEVAEPAPAAAPADACEQALAAIWASVLELPSVGRHDNFFVLGGHSLLATQILARVRTTLGVDLPLRSLFEFPTVAGQAAVIARLLAPTAEQAAQPVVEPILPVPRDGGLPLSFAQRRFWFMDQLAPDSALYNMPSALLLYGRLDVALLETCLNQLIERHEALRTTFSTSDGQPIQIIHPAMPLRLALTDLRGLPRDERMPAARQLADQEASQPFDLARGPLLRAAVLQLDQAESVLLLTMHHIVADGSQNIITQELSALYQAGRRGETAQLPALPIQYADYAAWQHSWLAGPAQAAQLAYWRAQLGDDLTPLRLPTDRPRPPMQTYRGARRLWMLPDALHQALQSFSRRADSTLFTTVLAGFAVLLARYSGQERIAIGTPVVNRSHQSLEHVVGAFANTLVLRADLRGDPSFHELLARVRQTTLDAYANQDLPFELLVDALQSERDPSHNPLCQVMLAVQQAAPALELDGLRARSINSDGGTARFDLLVALTEVGGKLMGALEYSTDLFDGGTIDRLIAQFERLLARLVEQPEQRISTLSLLSDEELRQQLGVWNASARVYERSVCLHQLFERQVQRAPEALAVYDDTQRWSYAELNARANRLAHQLRALGLGPGALVAVVLDRSVHMLEALLGILKAGAAYVPIEPGLPDARIQWIIGSLGLRCVVCEAAQAARFASLHGQLICLDASPASEQPGALQLLGPEALAAQPTSDLPPQASADDLAYIIFTSGSTGTPKGVMVRHRPVINLIEWANRSFGLGPDDRLLFVTSLSFDLSVYDIFGMLAAGASLRVAAAADVRDPERLVALLRDEPITFWDSAPPALQQLVPFFGQPGAQPPALRLVFLSGDWIPVTLPDQLRAAYPAAQVVSLGGATEATIWSNVYPIGAVPVHWSSIPYGRPIQNARYYILDARLNPLPIGVQGDLYIGGECLADGYAGAPDLTAERFLPDPYVNISARRRQERSEAAGLQPPAPSSRMYKTGDQARFWPDGTIEFLGRADQQVKIRGYRIELGEIESVLAQHPLVQAAVVLARSEGTGRRLVAYVVPTDGAERLAGLRSWLAERLPEYMLPATFVPLDALPLTSNGKLDRAALPAPDTTLAQPSAHVAPRSQAEQVLAQIWAEVLRVAQVGLHDNFFSLGGDSILGIQVIARARQRGLHLATRQIFQHQTIAELAAVVTALPQAEAEQGLLTGQAALAPIQRWWLAQEQPVPQHWNQAMLLEARQPLDLELLERTFTLLLAHHDALRLRYRQTATGWQQHYAAPAGQRCCELVDLRGLPTAQQAEALERHGAALQAGLDLAAGPLLRAALFVLAVDQPAQLQIVAHHLVIDGVSWRILLEDLQTAYRQLASGQPVALPAKTSAFGAWSGQLAHYASSPALRQELDYWRGLDWPRYQPLPLDTPAGENSEAQAEQITLALTADDTRALLQDAPETYHAQIDELLLAALADAFADWSGQEVLLLDLEGHGRDTPFATIDLSRTIGWHTTLFPLLLPVAPGAGPAAALQQVKASLRALPQRGLGYGLLRYGGDAAAAQELAGLPTAPILFNYLGQFSQDEAEGSLLRLGGRPYGAVRDPRSRRSHLLEINGAVSGGQLRFQIVYSRAIHQRATIARLSEAFRSALTALAAATPAPAGSFTPADFPLAGLSQQQLDRILAKSTRS